MTHPRHERSQLPHVEEIDVLSLVYEEVVDTRHDDRWQRMATSHPVLAREVLRRAALEGTQLSGEDLPDHYSHQSSMINIASYVLALLEAAAERERSLSVGDGGGEDRPPSA